MEEQREEEGGGEGGEEEEEEEHRFGRTLQPSSGRTFSTVLFMYVSVYERVCERKRKRKREGEKEKKVPVHIGG